MEHPLIGKLDSLTTDQIREQIYDLTKKMNFAMRMNQTEMVNQIRMALESYNTTYQARLKADNDKTEFTNVIDIK